MVVENVSSDAVRNGTVNARLDRVKLLRWPWHMANIITVLSKPLRDHLCVVDLKTAWIWCSSQERKRRTLWQWLPKVAVLANMWPFQRGLDRHDGILCISLHRLDLMPICIIDFFFFFFLQDCEHFKHLNEFIYHHCWSSDDQLCLYLAVAVIFQQVFIYAVISYKI